MNNAHGGTLIFGNTNLGIHVKTLNHLINSTEFPWLACWIDKHIVLDRLFQTLKICEMQIGEEFCHVASILVLSSGLEEMDSCWKESFKMANVTFI